MALKIRDKTYETNVLLLLLWLYRVLAINNAPKTDYFNRPTL